MPLIDPASLVAPGYRLVRSHTSTSTGGTRRTRPALSGPQIKTVKRIVNADKETFVKSTALAAADITNTAVFNDLTSIAQGDDHDQRLGDSVKCQRLFAKLQVARDDNVVTTDSYDDIRFIIFVWHPDDNTDAPDAITKILNSATSPQLQPYVLEKSKRKKFTVLYDKRITLTTRENGEPSKANRVLVVNKKLKNVINFNDAATTGRNKIYIMRIGSQAAGSDNSAMNAYLNVSYKQK